MIHFIHESIIINPLRLIGLSNLCFGHTNTNFVIYYVIYIYIDMYIAYVYIYIYKIPVKWIFCLCFMNKVVIWTISVDALMVMVKIIGCQRWVFES